MRHDRYKVKTQRQDRKTIIENVSNEYATRYVFALAHHFSISISQVLSVFDDLHYWEVINDDEVCLVLAHDAIYTNIKEIEERFKETLSRLDIDFENYSPVNVRDYITELELLEDKINFESQSITIIEKLIKDKKINREQAIKRWLNSKTYAEIVNRELTHISAMRAYIELELEENNDADWMRNSFE